MKFAIAIFLMLCLQVAMSPLCLCFAGAPEQEKAKPTCCHTPEGEEPAPCPHCDQEMPIAATAPVKAAFSADPPEWHGFHQFICSESIDAPLASIAEPIQFADSRDFKPPLPAFSKRFGVFLI